jgi:hypothetical protein
MSRHDDPIITLRAQKLHAGAGIVYIILEHKVGHILRGDGTKSYTALIISHNGVTILCQSLAKHLI